MVIIFFHQIFDIVCPPFCHLCTIIEFHLGTYPYIRILIHNIHSVFVACFQQLPAHRIMGAADCIEAGFFEFLYPRLRRMRKFCCSDNSVVMMDTSAAKFYNFSIHSQSVFCIQLKFTNSEGSCFLINHGIIFFDIRTISIQVWILRIPTIWIWYIHFLLIFLFRMFLDRH